MAQVSQQHVAPLSSGFVALTLLALFGIAILNHFADR